LATAIPPRGILFCHAYDQLLDLLGDTRSPKLLSLGAPVELLRDQSLVPAQEGVRGGKGRDLFETCATERVGERRKAAALAVRQAPPSAPVVGFENAVFLLEISNDVLLVTLEPAGDHRDEDVKDHGVPRVENRVVRAYCSILSTQEVSIGCQRRPETARKRLGCNGWLGRSVFFPT
jgi:hypothetical protein